MRSVHARKLLERPSVQHEGVFVAMEQREIQHIERTDRDDAGDQRGLAMAVQRLQRETARVDLAAFGHELDQRVVEVLVTRKRLVAEFRKAALYAERHAWAVQQDRSFK